MQYLRAHDDVDAVISEGQTTRISTDRPVERLSTGGCQHASRVESNRRQEYSVSRRHRSCARGNVTQSGTHIEKSRTSGELIEAGRQLVHRRADTAEQRICLD